MISKNSLRILQIIFICLKINLFLKCMLNNIFHSWIQWKKKIKIEEKNKIY
jgi:hypothetical protein